MSHFSTKWKITRIWRNFNSKLIVKIWLHIFKRCTLNRTTAFIMSLFAMPSGGLFRKNFLGLNVLQRVENRYFVYYLFSIRSKKENLWAPFLIASVGPGSFAATRRRSCRYVATRMGNNCWYSLSSCFSLSIIMCFSWGNVLLHQIYSSIRFQ